MDTETEKITVLGKTFNSEEERRSFFREELRKKLPELKQMEGFPIGEDEDIINLSDPPYYTACPNPWLAEIEESGEVKGNKYDVKVPFSDDFTVDQRHPVYLFHPYHTKVPPSIISTLIEYYTKENDVVLDVFAGSGMTGVAARELNRKVILNDLSPVASFISGVNTTTDNAIKVVEEAERILEESEREHSRLYKTSYGNHLVDVNYFVWADIFICPECVHDFPFFPHGVIHHGNKVQTKKQFNCPSCNANLNIRKVNRFITQNGKAKKVVWVNAGTGKNRISREANDFDLRLAEEVEFELSHTKSWFPKDAIDPDGYSAKLAQLGNKRITDISKFLSSRNLIVYSDLWNRMEGIKDTGVRNGVRSILTSIFTVISERQGYFGGGGGMSGNLYMPVVRMEKNVFHSFKRKIKKFKQSELKKPKNHFDHFVTNQSSTELKNINDESIDYIYTDPPFGANIIYSEMNLLLEGWLKVKTNEESESVINETKNKSFFSYGELMTRCFRECYRVLKPGRWMSVEFHNTKAAVWNLIQSSISESGFIIAQVNKLDKGSTTILADIRPGAAVQDLIISCYKPDSSFEQKISSQKSNSEISLWEFVSQHLGHLPINIIKNNKNFANAERSPRVLFDRLIAFYIQRNLPVPIDSMKFQQGLREHFLERDGMFFTAEQVHIYDKKKAENPDFVQLSILVSSEQDGVHWLKNLLSDKKQTYQEIHPQWMQALAGVRKGDVIPEMADILEENFLKDDQGKWYVPDPENEADLEKLRTKRLLKQFEVYKTEAAKPKGKIKEVRVEALRAGFKQSYHDKDFKTIVQIGDRIPNNLLMEDEVLLQFYDIASSRV